MSFEEQERALFDLLFDRTLRSRFCKDSVAALGGYDLNDAEKKDFSVIRADAIELDAGMRVNFILSHICRSFPLTFSIVSSLPHGFETLKDLIDTETMRAPAVERSVTFGAKLHEHLTGLAFESTREQNAVMALAELESSMAWTCASLKKQVLRTGAYEKDHEPVADDWLDEYIKLADYVSVGLIPQPYTQLKSSLCPCVDTELWRHLSRHPLTAYHRRDILQRADPRLMLTQAYVGRMSRCEPVIAHRTAELAEGFAHLFQYINGAASANEILRQFKQAGAPDQMLQSVSAAFKQLLANGMLVLAR